MSPRHVERELGCDSCARRAMGDPGVPCPTTGPIPSPSPGSRQARSRHRPLQLRYQSGGQLYINIYSKLPGNLDEV